MKKLNTQEELAYLKSIYSTPEIEKILHNFKETFGTLYTRSQVILSLTTVCLTITGFLGPKLATASQISKVFVIFGLSFVFAAMVMLFFGPLYIQWISQHQAESFDETVKHLIRRRDRRTLIYRLSIRSLGIGLLGYVISVIAYLMEL